MKIKHIIPLSIIFFGLTALSFMASDGVTLKLQPKKDKTYTIQTKNVTVNLMDVQGQVMTATQTDEKRQSFTVKECNDKEVFVEGKTEAIKIEISQMGMSLTYDSEHPEKTSSMLAGQVDEFGKMINKPFTVKYDVLGNRLDNAEVEDDELEQGSLRAAIVRLPEEPIVKGLTWTTTEHQEVSGTKIDASMTYTVTKVSRKAIEVSVSGTASGDDITGTYNGEVSLDPETGLVKKSSIKHNLSLTISQQGLSIPLTTNGTTTVTVE